MHRLLILLAFIMLGIGTPAAAQLPRWTKPDAAELLSVVDQVGAEGLDPADYGPAPLRAALASGNQDDLDRAATAAFEKIAHDFGEGRVGASGRIRWRIPGRRVDSSFQQALMLTALGTHQVQATLQSLLPRHPEYGALKAALAATPPADKATVQRLRTNLERWRWMPRDFGRRYLLVNVAAFQVALVVDGKVLERHRIIVGKPRTPTPQFAATVQAVLINPWWDVPSSIIAESVGRLVRNNPKVARARGYVGGGGHIRQRPGPGNALGQIKLVMPNPFTVYLHDTPSKELFNKEVRTFSHGCIRTQDVLGLAATLLASRPEWNQAAIERVMATRVTTQVPLDRPVPIYVTYFTAASSADGMVESYPDVYGRDGPVVAGLGGRR